MVAGQLEQSSGGNIGLAWSITFLILAGIFVLAFAYHKIVLPYPPTDKPIHTTGSGSALEDFFRTFVLFFRKKNIIPTLLFLLFYRFAEAQLVKLVSPFLLDAREKGGLGLSTSEVGVVYGTVGIYG